MERIRGFRAIHPCCCGLVQEPQASRAVAAEDQGEERQRGVEYRLQGPHILHGRFRPSFCAGRSEDRPTLTPVRTYRAIAAEDLGLVEGLVGAFDQRLGGIPRLILCETKARRYGGCGAVTVAGDLHPEALCQPARFSKVGLGGEDDELFPAPASQPVGRAEYGFHSSYDLAQYIVPAIVTVGIVHALEVVQIEENDGERSLVAFRLVRLLPQLGIELAAVGHSRQRICVGQTVHDLGHLPLLEQLYFEVRRGVDQGDHRSHEGVHSQQPQDLRRVRSSGDFGESFGEDREQFQAEERKRDPQGCTVVEDQVRDHVEDGQGGVSDLGDDGTGIGQTTVCVENVGEVDKREQDDSQEHHALGQPYRNDPTPYCQNAGQVEQYEQRKGEVGDEALGAHGDPDQDYGGQAGEGGYQVSPALYPLERIGVHVGFTDDARGQISPPPVDDRSHLWIHAPHACR